MPYPLFGADIDLVKAVYPHGETLRGKTGCPYISR
jgi:hypothetical protein